MVKPAEKTFVEKLVDNPSLNICAPFQLETEIMAKIEQKFPKDKATRHIDVKEAQEVAKRMMARINVVNDIDAESLKKAHGKLKDRDRKDVPFMALCFSAGASGILTNDRDFEEGGSVKIWNTKEAGRVATILNKGTFCFAMTTGSLTLIAVIIKEILAAIWAGIIFLVTQLVKPIASLTQLAVQYPYISCGVACGLFILNEKTGCISIVKKEMSNLLVKIKDVISKILQIITDLSGDTIELCGMLMEYYQKAVEECSVPKYSIL